jgi:hypothetical protein
MHVPAELAERFQFARQKSKLAGTIGGSFFVIGGSTGPTWLSRACTSASARDPAAAPALSSC